MTQISENALKLIEKRYLLRDSDGNLLEHSWSDIAKRVANSIGAAEEMEGNKKHWTEVFYNKINNFDFIPSSPCLFNAGTPSQQLSSCFVVDIEDNIEGIFRTVAECAKIFQMSGGAGFSMKNIRPKGAECKSSGSTASGVVSFMHVFDEVVNRVKQGNKRNGALKIDLPVDHPEIFEFIHCKDNTDELNNMNISVSITNEFIEAVEKELPWELKFEGKIFRTVKAKDLWNEIMLAAWKTGEPGISYQSNMDSGNMNPHLNLSIYGNPCHEFVNIPYSSCNLASILLNKCVINGKLNEQLLEENVKITVRFLDNMITANKLPLPKIQETTNKIRPIGLGTMGYANLLYELKIPYDSDENIKYTNYLYSKIMSYALEENIKLAHERGTYPAWNGSKWDTELNTPVRCSSMLSIAPNGSIAFIANTTGGCEPEYALCYQRIDKEGDTYYVVNPVFKKYLKENNLYNDQILKIILDNKGSIKDLDTLFPKHIQKIFVTANDISPEWHVKILSAIQKYVDLSISKTINMPNNATVEDIGNVYLMAGKMGIKGVTVYRDGCRESQVLSTNMDNPKKEELHKFNYIQPISRSIIGKTYGSTVDKRSACGKMYVTINRDKYGNIIESFVNVGKAGICKSNIDGINRLISLNLRSGVKIEEIIDQLKGITCPACTKVTGKGEKKIDGISCPDILARTLEEEYKNKTTVPKQEKSKPIQKQDNKNTENICPECSSSMNLTEGCVTCLQCGFSRCS
jgi:ribonucleoside-diphosphate reductase alpha chain